MIVVYGDTLGCLTCQIIKSVLKSSSLDYRFYELGKDFTLEELYEIHNNVTELPFILKDGNIISLNELEKLIF